MAKKIMVVDDSKVAQLQLQRASCRILPMKLSPAVRTERTLWSSIGS